MRCWNAHQQHYDKFHGRVFMAVSFEAINQMGKVQGTANI